MISELLIHIYRWTDVWYAHPGKLFKGLKWSTKTGRWHVGLWTGPQFDLLCVKRCETNEEANEWLSPGGRTILSATLKAIWKLRRTATDARVSI